MMYCFPVLEIVLHALPSAFTFITFLVSLPRQTFVGFGVGLLRRRSLSSFFADFDLVTVTYQLVFEIAMSSLVTLCQTLTLYYIRHPKKIKNDSPLAQREIIWYLDVGSYQVLIHSQCITDSRQQSARLQFEKAAVVLVQDVKQCTYVDGGSSNTYYSCIRTSISVPCKLYQKCFHCCTLPSDLSDRE